MRHVASLAERRSRRLTGRLLLLLLALVGLYVLVPQISHLTISRQTFQQARWWWVVVAAVLTITTYLLAALLYKVLALRPLQYGRTLAVQISSAFANRLLPGGFGGIGLNMAYLHAERHQWGQAGVVVAANNVLGVIGHVLLLLAVIGFGGSLRQIHVPHASMWLGVVLILAAATVGVVAVPRARQLVGRAAYRLGATLRIYRRHPRSIAVGLLVSICLTATYVGVLAACAAALRVDVSVAQLLIIFSVGASAGTATPTPGGVGGAEAGLIAGFVAYGVPGDIALATALLYRLLTYWLPLAPGFVAFVFMQRRLQ